MPLLTEYSEENLLHFHHCDRSSAAKGMERAIKIYWPRRYNEIARSRIKSACKIIRSLKAIPR